jgi:hypothetical protein
MIADKRIFSKSIRGLNSEEPPYILTTTFLLTLRNHKYIARTVKLSSELEKKSVLERLEIERRYWAAKQIDFGIITQKEIPTKMVKNIEWIHSSLYTYEERGLTKNLLENYCNILIDDSTAKTPKIL